MDLDYYLRKDNNNSNLFNPEQGYNFGNMFENLYEPYKRYQPKRLQGRTNQEKSFLELSRIAFAMHEMNLYLDVYPNDRKIQKLFNDYRRMFIDLEEKYEKNYGPLNTCSSTLEKSPFVWVNDKWPWEGGANV